MKVIYDLRLAEITSVHIEFSSSQLDPVILKGTSLICSSALSVQAHPFPCSVLTTMTNVGYKSASWAMVHATLIPPTVPRTREGQRHLQALRMKDERVVALVLEDFSVWWRRKAPEEIIMV